MMRTDIQCLRGIAIILVFLFHLLPNLFVNGFLGVDIFFVISGFLMAKILTKSSLRSVQDITAFYFRRFRRILTLYLFTIFLTVIMIHLYLPNFLWETNNRYSLASLFLVTNQLVIHDQADYFNEFRTSLSSSNAFLHLWSLSVEMQFYILAPIVFFGLQFLKNDYLKLVAVSITSVVGFICFVLIFDQFAFNFMLLRLWQFSAGFVSLFWSKIRVNRLPNKIEENETRLFEFPFLKEDMVIILIAVIGLCFIPTKLDVLILRPLVTTATALIIGCEYHNNQILKSKILGYIGDISYVMYLVHWPIITIFLSNTVKSYIFCTSLTILSSVVLHHTFEKLYLKLNWKSLICLLFALIHCNAYLQYSVREHNFWKDQIPEELQETVSNNQIILANQFKLNYCVQGDTSNFKENIRIFGYCKYPQGRGNVSIMTIGNSYALSFADLIIEQFKLNYSNYTYVSIDEGYGFFTDSPGSSLALSVFRKLVAEHKPDILFITPRYSSSLQSRIRKNDDYIHQMSENIQFYESIAKKIYILGSHPLYNINHLNTFLHYLIQNSDELESLHLNRFKSDDDMRCVKKRFEKVKCKKCQFFDLSHVFVEGDKYLTFDRDSLISYVDNTIHLTSAGLKLCQPVFENLAKEIMNNTN